VLDTFRAGCCLPIALLSIRRPSIGAWRGGQPSPPPGGGQVSISYNSAPGFLR
jgi:hypothetical protein